MGSVLLPSKLPNVRRYSYNYTPPLSSPSRRQPPAPPLKSFSTTPAAGMSSRYYRPPSPRGHGHPARSSTGTFDSYYDRHYSNHSSPRSSAERIAALQPPAAYTYAPGTEPGAKSSKSIYDSYTGRPRRNTHTESDGIRPVPGSLQPTMSIPIRTHGTHNYEGPSSPLAHSWDSRAETYATHAPAKRDHKRIYSVDDNRSAKLIAEIEPHSHEPAKAAHQSASRSGQRYRYAKPLIRTADLNDDDYSYTDPASMYRETEPVWRRPRSGSVERGSRPSSLIMEKGPRTSNRELGPPPSTRGFVKINSGVARNGSVRDPPRTSSWDRSGDVGKYRDDYYPNPPRSGSNRHPSTTVHQEHHDRRRDTYDDDHHVLRDREADTKRHGASDRYEDREVASRGFGIRTGESKHAPRDESLDRQPIWSAHESSRAKPDEYGGGFYPSEDPRRAPETRMPDPRVPRERDSVRYEERPSKKDSLHHERGLDDRGYALAAAPVAGAAVAYGATEVLKSRDRERDPEKGRDKAERYEEPYEERYKDEDRQRRHHRVPSSDESNDDRPRHYIDRDAARDSDSRRKDSTHKAEPVLDPDAEYRRRVQQEHERSLRSARDRDHSDSDREKERRRRKDDRNRDRDDSDVDRRQRASPTSTATEPAHSRYDDRSLSVLDKDIVQEPDSLTPADSRNMQIVAPPKDPAPQPKGILRKPTKKFPEDPEPIREGVAPHKSALKGKDIPPNARWTKIDRRLVNPEALKEAQERFEERMDCVIVLRVLTKQEIQKLADRTREIREAHEEEYEHERPHRRHRSRRDEEDRDDYDSEEEDFEKERERDRPRMIEGGR